MIKSYSGPIHTCIHDKQMTSFGYYIIDDMVTTLRFKVCSKCYHQTFQGKKGFEVAQFTFAGIRLMTEKERALIKDKESPF